MRIALIIGIDYYENGNRLYGCVKDAYSVKSILDRNDGGSINFECKLMTSSGPQDRILRSVLKDNIEQLFSTDAEIALLYFSGHGYIESTGGYIIASDSKRGDEGVSLNDILDYANKSPAKNKILILDSCHSGVTGSLPGNTSIALLSEGLTVLTASSADQYAIEENGQGLFTSLLVDALGGSAANLTGDITPGSIYAHIDQSLGAWEQRPIFKTNIKRFVSLRKSTPPINLEDLRKIVKLFPTPGFEFKLDPSYEPRSEGRQKGMPSPNPEHTATFAILQKYNRLNLLVPVDTPHMWNAAMESKSCRLTALGEHYRKLVEKQRI
jgi:hypothetical protein